MKKHKIIIDEVKNPIPALNHTPKNTYTDEEIKTINKFLNDIFPLIKIISIKKVDN